MHVNSDSDVRNNAVHVCSLLFLASPASPLYPPSPIHVSFASVFSNVNVKVGRPDDHVTELTDLVRARMDATNIQPEASVVGVGKCESTF